ncbi:protoporphyrinogen/coproporphyrinogen oxidase [Nocardia miyunensis]|uniref:protoporphyrinogen/coproporphyrinogen oxidase n=1 Tax=Nocardia miyunensis TaxID=282684 RepID=UPI000830E7C1|nr:NAD(P)/FAD-dependent oxidoreductase [Nocardia miyunensis]
MNEHGTAAVIGGGIAGMAAAYELRKAGFTVTVFESRDRVGGRIWTIRKGDFLMDLGTAVYLGTYRDAIAMIHEVGLTHEFVETAAVMGLPRDGVMHHLDLTKLVRAGLTTRAISPMGKLKATRLVADVVRNRKGLGYDTYDELAKIDTETVTEYGRRALNAELLEYLAQPLVSGTWVADANETSVALLHWTVRNMLVSHVYNLTSGVAGLPEHVSTLVDTRLEHRVVNVTNDNTSVSVTYESPGAGQHTETFDACVIATTAEPALEMYPQMDDNHRGLYETNRYRRLGSIVIGFSERPRDSATFCLIPGKDDPDTISIVADHNKAPGRAPEGKGLITVLLAHEYLDRTDHLPDADILDRAVESVKRYYGGLPGEVEEHAVVRWAESVPAIGKGRFRRIADFRRHIDPTPRVQFASDMDRIPGLNGALVSGKEAAARVSAQFSRRVKATA